MVKNSVHFDRKIKEFVGLTDAIKGDLKKAFPGVDLEREFSKMVLWLQSAKGKARKGEITFIMSWLGRKHNITTTESLNLIQSDTHLGHLLRDYLQGLWKNREHIFEFNRIKR